MSKFINNYKLFFKSRANVFAFFSALFFLIISLVINYYAGLYAQRVASNAVTDMILSHIRSYDVDFFFVWGAFAMVAFIAMLCIQKPQRLPFTVKTIALFVLIRSIFITLTHLGPYPTAIDIQSVIMQRFSFGGDLFFSGHTGLPFLLALIYWECKQLRYLFIFLSVFFAFIVLMGHLHYSIDVFSAFFITYTIFRIAKTFFYKEYKLFKTV